MSEDLSTAFAQTIGDCLAEATRAPDEVPAGQRRYVIKRVLGEGGMGRVLEATDQQFARPVALKQLRREIAGAVGEQRFTLEALVTGHLEHPGVPTVYERGTLSDGLPFYAMRLVQGRTLADVAARATTLQERLKLIPVVVRVAQTLAFAHERGVIHRDIKPENIVVGRHGETVVLDWGIAKVRGTSMGEVLPGTVKSAGASHETQDGSVIGTPAYMAPEQATGDLQAIDERTDVFALGALLYHLFTGRGPYSDVPVASIIDRATHATFDSLDTLAPDVPKPIRAICKKAMARSADDRYPTAGALAEALEGVAADALGQGHSRLVDHLASGVIIATLGMAILALGIMWANLAPFKSQGWGAYVPFLGVVGCVVAVVEWRTLGRHKLEPLVVALIAAVLLGGFASALAGLELVLGGGAHLLDTKPLFASKLMVEGTYEALGGLARSTFVATAQVVLWGAARRATLLAPSAIARPARAR